MKTILRAFSPQAKYLVSVKLLFLLVFTFGSFVASGQGATSGVAVDNEPGGGQQLPSMPPPFGLDLIGLYGFDLEPGGGQQVPRPRLEIVESSLNEPGTVSPMQPQKKLDFAWQDHDQIINSLQGSFSCNSIIMPNEPGGGTPSIPRKVDYSSAIAHWRNRSSLVFKIHFKDNHLEPGGTVVPMPKKMDAVPDVFV